MGRKGISPVVGVVIMVAVTISIGILVTIWVTNWVQHETSDPDKTCAINTKYIIESAEWDKTVDLNSSLLLKVTNKGKTGLYGFGVSIENGTYAMDFDYTVIGQGDISISNKLSQEYSVYLIVNLTNTTTSYPALGASLVGSDDITVRVTNLACRAVSAEILTVS